VIFYEGDQVHKSIQQLARSGNIPLIIVDWQQQQQHSQPQPQPQLSLPPPTKQLTANDDLPSNVHFLRKPICEHHLVRLLREVFVIPSTSSAAELVPPLPHNNTEQQQQQSKRTRTHSPTPITARILVVDDNIVNRKVVQHMLEILGVAKASIYTASNGVEAISALVQQMADIVFLDLDMPLMNGIDTAREVRKRWPPSSTAAAADTAATHQSNPYIVAFSADATELSKQQCLQAGMNGFLSKPIQFADLAAVVNLLRSSSQEES
jgi:CheY-like chemotaxis protein